MSTFNAAACVNKLSWSRRNLRLWICSWVGFAVAFIYSYERYKNITDMLSYLQYDSVWLQWCLRPAMFDGFVVMRLAEERCAVTFLNIRLTLIVDTCLQVFKHSHLVNFNILYSYLIICLSNGLVEKEECN